MVGKKHLYLRVIFVIKSSSCLSRADLFTSGIFIILFIEVAFVSLFACVLIGIYDFNISISLYFLAFIGFQSFCVS